MAAYAAEALTKRSSHKYPCSFPSDKVCSITFGSIITVAGRSTRTAIGDIYSSKFIEGYGKIIDAVREANPDAVIYIQEILPVSNSVSSTHDYIKNSKIDEYNELLQQLAEEKQVYFIDTAKAVAASDGSLPEDAAVDGIHMKNSYCQKWLDYLMTHTVN